MGLLSYTVLGLMFIVMLAYIYFSKKRVNNYETKIYGKIIITNIVGQILHLLCFFVIWYHDSIPKVLFYLVAKGYLLYLITWGCLNLSYIFLVSFLDKENENHEKILKIEKYVFGIPMIISSLLIILLPINYYYGDIGVYTYGPSVDAVYIISSIWIIACLIMILSRFDKNKLKKYIPLFIFMIIGSITMMIQRKNPELLLITFVETFVTFLMYFTIENPDVQMIEQLEIAKEQADRANNAKSDFLSNMSHEIRTPLNAIVGFSETLKDEDIPDSARENVDDIIMASNNLLDIVNGILDISKIEANKLEIINKEYDIKSVLDELTALTKARIGDKGLDFRVNIDPALPRVLYGDNIRIKQVILNILTNAVKYTKEGYVIFTVSSVIKDDVCRLIVSVEDSGIGIKEESIPKLFSKFERLDVEKEITIEGTGLGLAITKRLVELMNGTIVVQSVYGKGSKFTISIDQRIVAVEPPRVKESPASQSTFVDAKGARILIVDDNELNLKVASVLLSKYHFTIDTATNGIECVNKVKRDGNYDIIFLDDMMPKMSGREALARLKQDPNFKIPVIALTANAITGMRQEYLNAGFNDYLSKPIEKPELERVIKEYISQKRKDSTNSNLSKNTSSLLEKEINVDIPANNPENTDFSSKKVLVVDDNEMNLKIALNSLKKYGFEIDSVTSGSAAISKVIENKYDLIFLDEMMPELDGCNTLKNFRDIEDFNTPTIMMTASSEDEVKDKLEEYQFNGYLAKPFKKEELDKVINEVLK